VSGQTAAANVLPEQRHRVSVQFGGISTWHVLWCSTFPAAAHPGQYTRRAAERRALCGSLRAMLVGVDAADWPTERTTIDASRVTCKRCLTSYEDWLAKTGGGA
jgi:hypothetical protein